MSGIPVTAAQDDYVRSLQRSLGLSNAILDAQCVKAFGVPFARIDRAQCSQLIDTLKGWKEQFGVPREVRVLAGQTELFG